MSLQQLLIAPTVLLFSAGCGLSNPIEIEIEDGSSYSSPQEEGVLDVAAGTKFIFYSTVGGLTAVVRFGVAESGSFDLRYSGRDVFAVAIRLAERGPTVAVLAHEEDTALSLTAKTDYYLEIEQTGGATMGASTVTIRRP